MRTIRIIALLMCFAVVASALPPQAFQSQWVASFGAPAPAKWPLGASWYSDTVGVWWFDASTNIQPDSSFAGGSDIQLGAGAAQPTFVAATNNIRSHYYFDGSDQMGTNVANWNASAASGFITMWIFPTSAAADKTIFASNDENSTTRHFILNYQGGATYVGVNIYLRNNDANTASFSDTGTVPTNQWSQITLVSDATNYIWYVNGLLVPHRAGSDYGVQGRWFSSVSDTRDNVTLGYVKWTTGPIQNYIGKMSTPVVGNYILSSNEAYQAYIDTKGDYGL